MTRMQVSLTLENDQHAGADAITFVRNQNGSVTITVEADEGDVHTFVASAEEAKELGEYFGAGPKGPRAAR